MFEPAARESSQALADQIAINSAWSWPATEPLDNVAARLLRCHAQQTAQTIKLHELAAR